MLIDDLLRTRYLEPQFNIDPGELAQARERRDEIRSVLVSHGPTYTNGSVAHGDAIRPISDVDVGVVVKENASIVDLMSSPSSFQKEIAAELQAKLQKNYRGVKVSHLGRKRSILVEYGDSIDQAGKPFTADVIVALSMRGQPGLYIPHYTDWSRSDPRGHSQIISAANERTNYVYAKTVRLLKGWARREGLDVYSWYLKCAAEDALKGPDTLSNSMLRVLERLIRAANGDLPLEDPSNISGPLNPVSKPSELVSSAEEAKRVIEAGQEAGDNSTAVSKVLRHLFKESIFPKPPLPLIPARSWGAE